MILRNKEKMYTNQKFPKYFVQWEERLAGGSIRTKFRVFEHELNQMPLVEHLALDPRVTELYYGTGRPNSTRTVLKIDERTKFERTTDDIHPDDEQEGGTDEDS